MYWHTSRLHRHTLFKCNVMHQIYVQQHPQVLTKKHHILHQICDFLKKNELTVIVVVVYDTFGKKLNATKLYK